MILNLFVLVAILCTINPVLAEAEPHSGAHPGAKIRVAEAEPHSGAHPGAKVTVKAMAKQVKTQLRATVAAAAKAQAQRSAAGVEKKREFVRGQSVRLESVQQPLPPQPTHIAGNRLLVQTRFYDAPGCPEDSLFMAFGNAANVCIPEENVFNSSTTITTAHTSLKVNTPEGTYINVVHSYYTDRYCTSPLTSETIFSDSTLLDVCVPVPPTEALGFEGKFVKNIASKEVLVPTATANKGVLLYYYGGKRGCEERDMLALTDYSFMPEECMVTDDGYFFKFSCDENGPKYSSYADAGCSTLLETDGFSNSCALAYFRADCITQPPQLPVP